MKKLTTLFFTLLFSLSAIADCEPVDLDAKDGTLHEIPRFKQTLNTCVGHTMAAMYDAYRKKHNQGNLNYYSSPADVAYQISKNQNTLGDSRIDDIILLSDSPPCPTLESVNFDKNQIDRQEAEYAGLEKNLNQLAGQLLPEKLYSPEDQAKLVEKYGSILDADKHCANRKNSFGEVYNILSNLKINDAVALNMNNRCEPKDRLKIDRLLNESNVTNVTITPNSINLKTPTHEQLRIMRHINSEFDVYKNKSLPLGIGFCSTSLSKGSNFTFKQNPTEAERNRDCVGHAVLISGRRKNPTNGRCEFKIRNSWGSCSVLNPEYECNKNNGDTWMPQDVLERYLITVTIVK